MLKKRGMHSKVLAKPNQYNSTFFSQTFGSYETVVWFSLMVSLASIRQKCTNFTPIIQKLHIVSFGWDATHRLKLSPIG